MKEKLHYILLLITILLVASISLANMQSVNVSFILFSFKLPLIILILVSVLLGSVTTFLISMLKNFSLKKELKKTKEALKNSHTENQVGNHSSLVFLYSLLVKVGNQMNKIHLNENHEKLCLNLPFVYHLNSFNYCSASQSLFQNYLHRSLFGLYFRTSLFSSKSYRPKIGKGRFY